MDANKGWSPSEFPISYWIGPPEAELEPPFPPGCEPWIGTAQSRYQQVADAGFTFAMPSENPCLPGISTPQLNLKFLAAAGAAGLKAFVHDTRIDTILNKRHPHAVPLGDADTRVLDSIIADYQGHPALAGYFLIDEPHNTGSMNHLLAAVVAHFRAHDPEHVCFINNYPIPRVNKNYYENFVLEVKPFTLSYDNYFFRVYAPDNPTFFLENLEIARSVALPHDLPFWVIVQAIRHTLVGSISYRQPTEAEKRFEVMQSLAFGAKGILYFTYWTPPNSGKPDIPHSTIFYPAIIDRAGVPTPQYAGVTRINRDVRAIGRYLLAAESVMVYDSVTPPTSGLRAPPPAAPVTLAYPAAVTVGVFTDAAYTYTLLANRDYRDGTVGPAMFRATTVMQLDKKSGAWVDTGSEEHGSTEVSLAPGDAELYRLISPYV
jgi:hypothetical protein